MIGVCCVSTQVFVIQGVGLKHWRIALVGLLALLVMGFALLWFLPARWALPLLASRMPGLHLQEVSGLIWDGRAGQVLTTRGENLGKVDWQISRRALFGDNRLHVNFHGPLLDFTGSMAGAGTEARWTDVHLRVNLDLLPANAALPVGRPRGVVDMTVSRLQLRGGWPLELDAQGQWQDAAMLTPKNGELSLGTLPLTLQASNGVISGQLQDDGHGPLHVDGQLQLSPLARRFTAQVSQRETNPALQRWLSTLGTTDAEGVTHIHYSGGLAAAMPEGRR
jgi:general secretion pathway protein N